MAECHVVINEAPPTDDDAGVAGSGSDRSVGMAGVEWADSTAQFKAPNGAVAEAAGRGAGSPHYCVSGGPAPHDRGEAYGS